NNWAIDNILVSEATMASLQGYVTDEERGDPIEYARIEVGSYQPVYTDEEGYYSVDVAESSYSVSCSAEGYLPELVEEIIITGVVSQDFALEMEACDPPLNLVAEFTSSDIVYILLTWEPPGGSIDTWIHYDDGVNYSSIGLCDGCSFMVAIRFDPGQLEPYAGTLLTEAAIFINGPYAGYELMIWTGENATNLVYNEVLTGNLIIGEWNTIGLGTPIPIDITQELWIGYAVIDQSAGEFPAGCDEGPAFTGYGDMINHEGVAWEPLSNYGFNYNWNIQGHVVDIDGEMRKLCPLEQVTFNNSATSKPVAGKINSSPSAVGPNYGLRSLLGYNVYRNYMQLNDSLVLSTSYLDGVLLAGVYEYYVTAVYTLCESEPSNVVIVYWPSIDDLLGSEIKVYPIPATNFINVEVPEGICEIRMVNYLGDIVYMQRVGMERSLRIRTGAYSSGIYLLEFVGENGSIATKRIILTK
ncbi:MAG: carboxypeptidase regulatory-like domain-containing protein, partial [Bacteroidales bacterium]|nr:carboxypeptidase regulatory-like domain-containing protein [Bacteroidales bacterium]